MADTFTTNLVLTKPEIGASTDTWGTKLNANSDTIANMFSAGPALKVANGGTGATTAANARTNLGLGTLATQDANNVQITGGGASLSGFTVNSIEPSLWLYESDAATNEKYWRFVSSGGLFYLQTWNDAGTSSLASPIVLDRDGGTVTSIAFNAAAVTINGSTVYHAGNIAVASIQESQIADGAIFPRLSANETVTGAWTFSAVGTITRSGQGRYVYLNGAGNTGGAITISASAASGTPANGDLWIQYV